MEGIRIPLFDRVVVSKNEMMLGRLSIEEGGKIEVGRPVKSGKPDQAQRH